MGAAISGLSLGYRPADRRAIGSFVTFRCNRQICTDVFRAKSQELTVLRAAISCLASSIHGYVTQQTKPLPLPPHKQQM